MKGDSCGFLHQLDPVRMPVCRALLKYGVCKEADCLFKHSLDDIKECNMYKLGFCIYGPQCRYKHTRTSGMTTRADYTLHCLSLQSLFVGVVKVLLERLYRCFVKPEVGKIQRELGLYARIAVTKGLVVASTSKALLTLHWHVKIIGSKGALGLL